MNWKMIDLAVRQLNTSKLHEWKDIFLSMTTWMQAVLVGTMVLLIGASALSCWWGLKMNRSARFIAGAAGVFHIVLVLLVSEYSLEMEKAFLYSALAGLAAGFLYAFLERIFQFAAGFVFGTVLSAWVLPEYLHLKVTSGKGRIWALVIAIAAGVLFALLAKKLKIVLTALEGGVVLGLLCNAFLPVGKIPWINEKLTKAQIQNLLPLAIAATGLLVQLLQLLAIRAEQKALEIPSGDDRDHTAGREKTETPAPEAAQEQDEEALSMAQAEEMLVEKAKELAFAANRSAEHARLKERYEDVQEGLYSSQVAAKRLGMSEDVFVAGMKKAGYILPGSASDSAEPEAAADSMQPDAVSENTQPDAASENTQPETAEEVSADGSTAEGAAKEEETSADGSGTEETPSGQEAEKSDESV